MAWVPLRHNLQAVGQWPDLVSSIEVFVASVWSPNAVDEPLTVQAPEALTWVSNRKKVDVPDAFCETRPGAGRVFV